MHVSTAVLKNVVAQMFQDLFLKLFQNSII